MTTFLDLQNIKKWDTINYVFVTLPKMFFSTISGTAKVKVHNQDVRDSHKNWTDDLLHKIQINEQISLILFIVG